MRFVCVMGVCVCVCVTLKLVQQMTVMKHFSVSVCTYLTYVYVCLWCVRVSDTYVTQTTVMTRFSVALGGGISHAFMCYYECVCVSDTHIGATNNSNEKLPLCIKFAPTIIFGLFS
jgi:hypothetical protein